MLRHAFTLALVGLTTGACGQMDLTSKPAAATAATGATGPSGDTAAPAPQDPAPAVAQAAPGASAAVSAPTGVTVAVSVTVNAPTPATAPVKPTPADQAAMDAALKKLQPKINPNAAVSYSSTFLDQDNKDREFYYSCWPKGGISFNDTDALPNISNGYHLASKGEVLQILSQHRIVPNDFISIHTGVWTSTVGDAGEHFIIELDTGISVSMGDSLIENAIYVSNEAQSTAGSN